MEAYQRLERDWARFNDLDPAGMVACSSGTAALHLALEALQLPSKGEVLTSDFNMVAVPRAIAMAGLTPVFVDCEEDLLVDPRDVTNLIGTRVNSCAVVDVHIYGRRSKVAGARGVFNRVRVVEDLAEAHGVRPYETSDAACWSFYRNKIVAGEEGGAVWFKHSKEADRARQLRSLGFTEAHDYMHVPRGHNYRMSNAHAEIILRGGMNRRHSYEMKHEYDETAMERRDLEREYDMWCPVEWKMPRRDAVWVYDLRLRGLADEYPEPGVPAWDRSDLMEVVNKLRSEGIEARPSFAPMSYQPEFQECARCGGDDERPMTQAERASLEVLYLPAKPGWVPEGGCRRAFEVIRSITESRRKRS